MSISVILGDITQCTTDAIVNAANANLLAGGGVCGAIHRAAGPQLLQACRTLGGCQTGSAVITPGFDLPAAHVIHAVGPRWWDGSRGEAELLRSCYNSIFELVVQHGIVSVAIPAISTGIYGYPLEQATRIAVGAANAFLARHSHVVINFICFDETTYAAYLGAVSQQTEQVS